VIEYYAINIDRQPGSCVIYLNNSEIVLMRVRMARSSSEGRSMLSGASFLEVEGDKAELQHVRSDQAGFFGGD
jgi:hypothetical protein